jgi:hypothetical protein
LKRGLLSTFICTNTRQHSVPSQYQLSLTSALYPPLMQSPGVSILRLPLSIEVVKIPIMNP